jgi:hypothetical protein
MCYITGLKRVLYSTTGAKMHEDGSPSQFVLSAGLINNNRHSSSGDSNISQRTGANSEAAPATSEQKEEGNDICTDMELAQSSSSTEPDAVNAVNAAIIADSPIQGIKRKRAPH